jgi:hypothetical protein
VDGATSTRIEAFNVRLREEVDPDRLSAELLAVVHQTMQPPLRPCGCAIGRAVRSHRDLNCPRGVLEGALLTSTRPASWADGAASSHRVLAYPGV